MLEPYDGMEAVSVYGRGRLIRVWSVRGEKVELPKDEDKDGCGLEEAVKVVEWTEGTVLGSLGPVLMG